MGKREAAAAFLKSPPSLFTPFSRLRLFKRGEGAKRQFAPRIIAKFAKHFCAVFSTFFIIKRFFALKVCGMYGTMHYLVVNVIPKALLFFSPASSP